MLLTVLLYGYCRGVYSSRKIASACESDVAFRVLSGGQFPDFRTVSDFRKNHLEAFEGLFLEVLRLCREAGLLKLGRLSLDGSKYQANASKPKAMSYGRIEETGPRLEAEVREMLRRAQEIDEAEDEEFSPEAPAGIGCSSTSKPLPCLEPSLSRRSVHLKILTGLKSHSRARLFGKTAKMNAKAPKRRSSSGPRPREQFSKGKEGIEGIARLRQRSPST